jgi:hypothetical protein
MRPPTSTQVIPRHLYVDTKAVFTAANPPFDIGVEPESMSMLSAITLAALASQA